MAEDLGTVTDALRKLAAEGYDADFVLRGNRVRCPGCGALLAPEDLSIHRVIRFEGPSDPGDEMIVVALVCGRCGCRGTLASTYGPATSPEEAEFLLALRDDR